MGHKDRSSLLYLAPWVDYGGTDKGTIDWFRWLDRDRFAPSLITTQPSENRRLAEILPFAEEVWSLPDLMSGADMPRFIFDFLHTREVEVLHVMNSRLGYELLPDLACLPRPPKVVVQLHVEEADKSGYVRYVTTRYGNLVDKFSVTSEHLARAVAGYGVSVGKIEVIYTGVDAEDEFSPEHSAPVDSLAPDCVHVLYPGRLVEQKDPQLMVKVAAGLRERGLPFQIHAVGEGDLEADVRAAIEENGLAGRVLIHPPTNQLQRWYAACDLLLMTSVYEGVPYVVFEAMAMGLPVVAPALAGNVELLGDVAGGLVQPRDDVAGYVSALAGLIEAPQHRDELARRGRKRVIERFSLQRMAREHERLYEGLVGGRPGGNGEASSQPPASPPLRFRNRRLYETPLVSVIVPCFNHGRFLDECLEAVRAQSHPAVETIVVDDASTDHETIAVLDELELRDDLTLVRMPENGGPSRARNAALDRCSGGYVLPVDADNILYPDAIERLVEQLKCAGEQIGFVYPNLDYFGNREDYFEAPDWNLYALMQRNVCDVCSLFDRDVFDAERFDESIRFGHEDWEFVLRLAARGVRGEPAKARTVRYRKLGFNRSDFVEYAASAFHELIRRTSPLYDKELEIKADSAPALSLVALQQLAGDSEEGARLARRLEEQSCRDLELVLRLDGNWPGPGDAPAVRRLPPALASSVGAALTDGLAVARGRLLGVTAGTGSALLADRGFVEKMVRILEPEGGFGGVDALVLARAEHEGAFPMQLLGASSRVGRPHTIVLTRDAEERLIDPVLVDAEDPVYSLAQACVAAGLRLQWRHVELAGRVRNGDREARQVPVPRLGRKVRGGKEGEGWRWPAKLPAMPGSVPRWSHSATWIPPQSTTLCRHREVGGDLRVVTTDRRPPPGFELEYDLGSVRVFSLEGTARLLALEDGHFVTTPRGKWEDAPEGARHLGYVELVAFPGLEALVLGEHRATGQRVLVCGGWDPLLPELEPLATLGFVEPFPAHPRSAPPADHPFGLVGLTRAVDVDARRHRYAAAGLPNGGFAGELGALVEFAQPPAIPVWIEDGYVITEDHHPPPGRPRIAATGRWTLAPLRWRGFSEPIPKARAIARRSLQSGIALVGGSRSPLEPDGSPAGWLLPEGLTGTRPLYAAYHPVTGDQLLTTTAIEATDMGYDQPELLGHLRAVAPVTGSLEPHVTTVPWASRFGLLARRA